MAYKMDTTGRGDERTVTFEGVLDRSALTDLLAACESLLRKSTHVRVWLRSGTQVEMGVLDDLVHRAGISLAAESPFLERWIAACREGSGTETW